MAIISTTEFWHNIGVQLEKKFNKQTDNLNRYFHYYTQTRDNPLDGLTPLVNTFFGPRVCSLFIINRPYAEDASKNIAWPPIGYNESKLAIKLAYNQWTKYEINWYGDGLIIQQARSIGGPEALKFISNIESTFNFIQQDCENEMKEYGWKWKGNIESTIDPSYFYPVLKEFSNTQ
jgi:hypothetical protein